MNRIMPYLRLLMRRDSILVIVITAMIGRICLFLKISLSSADPQNFPPQGQ